MKAATDQARRQGYPMLDPAVRADFVARSAALIAAGLAANPPPPPGPRRRGRRKQTPARNLLERLLLGKDQVLAFLDDLTIPFDNNQAERDLRLLLVQQKVSGCFRSAVGSDAFARIRGYLATLRKQRVPLLMALASLLAGQHSIPVSPEQTPPPLLYWWHRHRRHRRHRRQRRRVPAVPGSQEAREMFMPFQSRGTVHGDPSVRSTATTTPILVAEDDELLRQTLRLLFEEEGYAVLEAADGRQALELLRTSPQPLVVVLDLLMATFSGEEVLYAVAKDRRLRRRHAFVLVTAAPHLSRRLRLMRVLTQLAIQRIAKPFDIDVLLDAVAQATRRVLGAPRRE
jgi:CheY-like chemotaxis protein